MLKKIASVFLVAVFILTVIPLAASAANTTVVTADGIDTVRGSGQLIIYTPGMGSATGTNEWGQEVVVVDNVATKYNTGNSTIPSNGFVISGHNSETSQMGSWITENIPIGSYVYYNDYGVITVTDDASSGSYTCSYNAVNSSRGTDQMIIYTRAGSTTGTNVYGYEVVVTGGYVTSVGGNNNTIPTANNSFVISGHGTAGEWLTSHVTVGLQVSYDTRTKVITFSYNTTTLAISVDAARNAALAAKQEAYNNGYLCSELAENRLASAESTYYAANGSFNRNSAEKLIAEYEIASTMFSDKPVSEYRGVWVRPTQTSLTEVRSFIKQLYDSGINMVSVETMYWGTMIYPTAEGSLFEHNPDFNGFDVLGAYVDVCHEYGMELHCWMPVFYSCSSNIANWELSPAYKKPEWCAVTNNGSTIYSTETAGMVFLNPALDEVQDFLIETYTHLLENYDIDGFQLDYIRYRDRTSTDDYGYDSETIAEFKQNYPQYNGNSITYNTRASYWSDWTAFRASQVTEFVEKMRNVIDKVAPDVLLSADVGPDPDSAYSTLYQNSTPWLENGWLDVLHPMAYGEGYASTMAQFVELAGDGCMVVPGLGAFMTDFVAADMARQTVEMREVGCGGVVYFEATAFLNKGCGEVLAESLFIERTVVPSVDNVSTATAWLNRLSYRVSAALSGGNISNSDASSLLALIDKAFEEVEENGAGNAYNTLISLKTKIDSLASGSLKDRLVIDMRGVLFSSLRSLSDHSKLLDNGMVIYDEAEDYVVIGNGVKPLSVTELVSLLSGSNVQKNGSVVSEPQAVATGMTLTNGTRTFTVARIGDINRDGDITAVDYALIKRSCLGTYKPSGASEIAADINGNGGYDTVDYALAKRHVLGTYNIYG
ncbi:MAG: family 10 glycosylhydrolase [Clostridia bacterium]|nr:family 10 glycosylhydrolase [Clostridia bacterium]